MNTGKRTPRTIDEYIAGFPEEVRMILEKIRVTIAKSAPEAEEAIKYGMPTFTLDGNLIHFAAHKQHIGLYPVPRNLEEFQEELATYAGEKSTARFPLDQPIPYALIRRIVKYRVKERQEKGSTAE